MSMIERHADRVGDWLHIDRYYDALDLEKRGSVRFICDGGYACLKAGDEQRDVLIDCLWGGEGDDPPPAEIEFIEALFWLWLEQMKETT